MVSIKSFFFFVSSLFLSAAIVAVHAKVRHHRWELAYEFKSPDCFQKLTLTINGQSPGPAIYAEQGDTVVVEVTNSLFTENAAIHWHGIRQVTENSSLSRVEERGPDSLLHRLFM